MNYDRNILCSHDIFTDYQSQHKWFSESVRRSGDISPNKHKISSWNSVKLNMSEGENKT